MKTSTSEGAQSSRGGGPESDNDEQSVDDVARAGSAAPKQVFKTPRQDQLRENIRILKDQVASLVAADDADLAPVGARKELKRVST